jgi:hypothetical protein
MAAPAKSDPDFKNPRRLTLGRKFFTVADTSTDPGFVIQPKIPGNSGGRRLADGMSRHQGPRLIPAPR